MLYFKGDATTARRALELVQETSRQNITEQLGGYFQSTIHYTAGAIETPKLIVAWVDHIRSWPIFYTARQNNIVIANNARRLQKQAGLNNVCQAGLTEFAMSGFVSGKYTIFQDLFCLQPGELLIFDKMKSSLETYRYFRYRPEYTNNQPQDVKKRELGRILDTITREIIERAQGRTIWVPLSAGLDSRLVLCKLHEHGYKNIRTLTYGPKYNFEALYAKKTAKTLGVSWDMISPGAAKIKHDFSAQRRRDFWQYADHYKAVPALSGFSALLHMHDNEYFEPGDIIINGQSGDFITGGHIPEACFKKAVISRDGFLKILTDKHYSLWAFLRTAGNLDIIHEKIAGLIGEDMQNKPQSEQRAGQAESWEYETRQACYVVNAQRLYEFLGCEWEMPLWDKRLVDFFATLSLADKQDQCLYKSYLRDYNYYGLFPRREKRIWRWPLFMLWVLPLAQIIGMATGRERKGRFYARMRYHGHYADQFGAYPLSLHKRTFMQARNGTALSVRQWILESGLTLPDSTAEYWGRDVG